MGSVEIGQKYKVMLPPTGLHTHVSHPHLCFQTSLETFAGQSLETACSAEADKRKIELSAACCLLLKTCLTLIHGVHDLQFTAMVTINKVIDTCVVYRLAHMKVKVSEALQHPAMA